MSKKPEYFCKSKVLKKIPFSKSGSSLSIHSNQLNYFDGQNSNLESKNVLSAVQYHPWELKYEQTFIREKIQKAMVKDTYVQTISSVAQADEKIVTEEECCPVLISADAIHIEKFIIHRQPKVILPRIIRYVRNNDIVLSELFVQQTSTNNDLSNQIKIENGTSLIRRSPRRFVLDTILEKIPECCNSDNCSCDITFSDVFSVTTLTL